MSYQFSFKLSGFEELIMEFADPLSEIDCCYEGLITLINKKEKAIVCHSAIRDSMYALRDLLKKTLQNNLPLHESITRDIGYLYNQYSYYVCVKGSSVWDQFAYEQFENSLYWVGTNNHLWASHNLVSWLYNDKDGNIIFEITPFYPFLYSDTKNKCNYVSFRKWMLNYKPYLIRKISREIAQQWLEQATYIADQIDRNIAQWQKEGRKK